MAVSKIAYLKYQAFCLGLLIPFAVSFCFCSTETTHSRDILHPNILLSVLQFFQFYLILPIFTPTNLLFCYIYIFWNLIYILIWKLAVCSFPISDWIKTPVLLHFEKSHIRLTRKVDPCLTFWKSNMINHNAQKLFNFLKNTI